jgi:hypothetical protein
LSEKSLFKSLSLCLCLWSVFSHTYVFPDSFSETLCSVGPRGQAWMGVSTCLSNHFKECPNRNQCAHTYRIPYLGDRGFWCSVYKTAPQTRSLLQGFP